MKTYAATLLLSLLAALLLTRLARFLGNKLQLVDVGGGRKLHSGSIPRIGGPAIAFATILPMLILLMIDNEIADNWRALGARGWAVIGCSLMAAALGLFDDLFHLRARKKLLFQIIISVAAYYLGLQIKMFTLPFFGLLEMGIFALPVTVCWFVGFMNVINLIDGMDGLCAGIVAIASLALFSVACVQNSHVVAVMSIAVFGAVLGFLRYNFSPASIFMGDSGSYFLGFVLAAISLTGSHKSTAVVAIATPLLALGIPILDTAMAITRRAVAGQPIFSPDRGHMHHIMLDSGHSTFKTLGMFYSSTSILALAGIIVTIGQQHETVIALATVCVLIIYLIRIIGFRASSARESVDPQWVSTKASTLLELLPDFIERLNHAQSMEDVELLLKGLGEKSHLVSVSISPTLSSKYQFDWRQEQEKQPARTQLLSVEHGLDFDSSNFGTLNICWFSEHAKPSLETKTLIRVFATMLARKQSRLSLELERGQSQAPILTENTTLTGRGIN